MSTTFDQLQPYLEKSMAMQTAMGLFEWDDQTAAPSEAPDYTSKVIGILSNEYRSHLINEEVETLLHKLQEKNEQENLSDTEKAIVKALNKKYEEMKSIPPEDFRAYAELTSIACHKWAKAKNENRYEDFVPYLQKLIDFNKKFASYRLKEGQMLYDILLGDNEEGFCIKELDIFFDKIKEAVIPLLKKVAAKADQVDKTYNHLNYEIAKQKEFCNFLSSYVGFNFNRGVLAESAHPFTMNLHNHDVRITTHYYENNLESAIFSTIHESGHALYEMNIADSLTQTLVGGGTSMGMHEAQSRFFENNIGRSKPFWAPVYEKLVQTYPEQLKDISLDHFIAGINKAAPNLIRIEADELQYSLHILIRYEIEKMIFQEDVPVEKLPEIWNRKYQEYLGITPPDNTSGILQDIHWAGGSFGYFPSYAIGSAVAAQIYFHMKKIMPLDQYLQEGNLDPIREFLKNAVHQYGATKNTNQILMDMMGEELNADYYIQYLTDKYEKLYEL